MIFHSKTKHVDTKYHYIKTLVEKVLIKLKYNPLEDQIADIFTKSLGKIKFTKFIEYLGIYFNVLLDLVGGGLDIIIQKYFDLKTIFSYN